MTRQHARGPGMGRFRGHRGLHTGPARLSPRADAIPPVGREPRARLGCQDREARASEGPPPPLPRA